MAQAAPGQRGKAGAKPPPVLREGVALPPLGQLRWMLSLSVSTFPEQQDSGDMGNEQPALLSYDLLVFLGAGITPVGLKVKELISGGDLLRSQAAHTAREMYRLPL